MDDVQGLTMKDTTRIWMTRCSGKTHGAGAETWRAQNGMNALSFRDRRATPKHVSSHTIRQGTEREARHSVPPASTDGGTPHHSISAHQVPTLTVLLFSAVKAAPAQKAHAPHLNNLNRRHIRTGARTGTTTGDMYKERDTATSTGVRKTGVINLPPQTLPRIMKKKKLYL